MDEQRKLLTALLDAMVDDHAGTMITSTIIADYLLAHGVLVPPCRIGDKLWWACDNSHRIFEEDPDIGVYEDEKGVQSIAFDGANFGVLIDGAVIPLGSQFAFLSEADARDWLEKRMKEEE